MPPPPPEFRNHAGPDGTQRERFGQLLPKFERSGFEDRRHRHLVGTWADNLTLAIVTCSLDIAKIPDLILRFLVAAVPEPLAKVLQVSRAFPGP